jgi:hypothetical protein
MKVLSSRSRGMLVEEVALLGSHAKDSGNMLKS